MLPDRAAGGVVKCPKALTTLHSASHVFQIPPSVVGGISSCRLAEFDKASSGQVFHLFVRTSSNSIRQCVDPQIAVGRGCQAVHAGQEDDGKVNIYALYNLRDWRALIVENVPCERAVAKRHCAYVRSDGEASVHATRWRTGARQHKSSARRRVAQTLRSAAKRGIGGEWDGGCFNGGDPLVPDWYAGAGGSLCRRGNHDVGGSQGATEVSGHSGACPARIRRRSGEEVLQKTLRNGPGSEQGGWWSLLGISICD